MKRFGLKLLLTFTVGLGSALAFAQQPTTAQASSKFSSIPTGYLQSAKAQYAFHWKKVTMGKTTGNILIFGNFKSGMVKYAIPTKYKLSKTKRTLTTYYKTISTKGKVSKATYRMDLYKYSTAHYRVKLNNYKAGRYPSYKGSSYTFSHATKSPASTYANKYLKTPLTSAYTTTLTKYVQQQFADGKTSLDPSTAEVQKEIADKASDTAKTDVANMVKSFNYSK